jgi:hypothetical protein
VLYVSWAADGKRLTVSLCLCAIIVVAAGFAVRDLRYAISLVQNADAEHLIGWDLLPTCHGLAALAAGKDPYIHSNLAYTPSAASWMAYYYPIAAAYPAKLICIAQDLLPGAYVGIYLLILAGSCAALAWSLRLSSLEVAIVALVSISAFSAYRWLALTGNIAVLEAPLAALSITALYRRRYEISGGALGLLSTLKVLPLVGVLAFVVIPVAWPQKARAIMAAGAAFVALHLINAAVSGAYFVSFVKASLGQVPDQPVLSSENGGLNNPDFIDFVFALFHTLNVDKATLVSSALAFCGLILGVAIAMLAQKTREMDDYAAVRIFGLTVLVCMLLLFRLKPYAFGTLVPFAIAAIAFPSGILRRIGYLTLSVMPWLCTSAWLAAPEVVRNYYQMICLMAFIVVALAMQIFSFTRTRTAPAATGDGPAPAG